MKKINKSKQAKRMKDPKPLKTVEIEEGVKVHKKKQKRKLTKKQILKRIILFIPYIITLMIFGVLNGTWSLLKLYKKHIKQVTLALIIIGLIICIVTIYIRMTNIQEQYNTYQTNTSNTIEDLTETINTYKIELDKYKEESDKKHTETEEKIKQVDVKVTSRGGVTTRKASTTPKATGTKAEYQNYAKQKCNEYGWNENDFNCLVKLWNRESNWNPTAKNKSSGAYGIPQSLPASKMASEGSDYLTNYKTQINWGLKYIKNRYGNPTNAWSHSQQKGWY